MKKLFLTSLLLVLAACGGGGDGGTTDTKDSQKTSYYGNTFENYNTINATDARAIDGDTIEVTIAGKPSQRIRLAGIDAPESNQPYGSTSTLSLADCMANQTVTIKWYKKDKYDRIIGYVLAGGDVCNYKQLDNGSAWHYKDYQDEQPDAEQVAYANAEVLAKQSAKGLWALPCPIAPWDWRDGLREADGCTNTSVTKPEPSEPNTVNIIATPSGSGSPSVCSSIPKTCGAMSSCTEAYTALNTCGQLSLDSDKDGVPCEAICT